MKLSRIFDTDQHRLRSFCGLAVMGLVLSWATGCKYPTLATLFEEEYECVVNSVQDGDTMRLTCAGERVKVRLFCIDAPELTQRPWGQESRDHLRAIMPKQVMLIPRDEDRYGRVVGEVFSIGADSENLNLAQVWSGNAAVYPRYCTDERYYEAEQAAKRESAGVWAREGEHQTPWRTRS